MSTQLLHTSDDSTLSSLFVTCDMLPHSLYSYLAWLISGMPVVHPPDGINGQHLTESVTRLTPSGQKSH